jgi:hypothetical protein
MPSSEPYFTVFTVGLSDEIGRQYYLVVNIIQTRLWVKSYASSAERSPGYPLNP